MPVLLRFSERPCPKKQSEEPRQRHPMKSSGTHTVIYEQVNMHTTQNTPKEYTLKRIQKLCKFSKMKINIKKYPISLTVEHC